MSFAPSLRNMWRCRRNKRMAELAENPSTFSELTDRSAVLR